MHFWGVLSFSNALKVSFTPWFFLRAYFLAPTGQTVGTDTGSSQAFREAKAASAPHAGGSSVIL